MKNLKYILVLFIIAFSNCSQGQIRNNLTTTEYSSIKINGINWRQINDTKANVNQMKTLFGNDIIVTTGTEPSLHKELWNDSKGFYFYFEENNPNDPNDYMLYDFKITNSNSNITLKGKTVTVGTNISELGNVQINASGSDIVYGTSTTDDILMIKFNPATNLITSIEYTLFN
jgi:hypothetical protein